MRSNYQTRQTLPRISTATGIEERIREINHAVFAKSQLSQCGMTLFEVAISMVIVAFSVVSVLMLLPIGIKAQQMARFQIYVSAKAEEMIEQFNATHHSNPEADTEGLAMWDVPVAHKAQSWDFESRLASHRFGNMPLPLEIARRLDSQNNEISEILDGGGYIYYTQPRATSGIEDYSNTDMTPNEAQRVIVGVKGYAQQNGISSFPLKNFPYYAAWPSPPVHFMHYKTSSSGDNDPFVPAIETNTTNVANFWAHYDWPGRKKFDPKKTSLPSTYCLLPWETAPRQRVNANVSNDRDDNDIQRVWDYPAAATEIIKVPDDDGNLVETRARYGFMQYAYGRRWRSTRPDEFEGDVGAYNTKRDTYPFVEVAGLPPGDEVKDPATHYATRFPSAVSASGDMGGYPSRPSLLRYVVATLWYAQQKKVNLASDDLNLKSDDYLTKSPYAPLTVPIKDQWKVVQAFRFLAHSTACLTSWYSYNKNGDDREDLATGVTIPEAKFEGGETYKPEPEFKITHSLIKYYHERSHYLINTFTASHPYDWAVPRSLNRPTMMDFSLMQFDLFSPPLPGQMATSRLYSANSWDYIFGRSTREFPQQWRVVSAQPIRNVGVSASYPTNVIDSTMAKPGMGTVPNSHFGNIGHFNLTAPFKAAERCRQLVFWSVDWQSYEDFETAPSAPPDASKYPIMAPRVKLSFNEISSRLPTPITWDYRMLFFGNFYWSYRNPELSMLYHPAYIMNRSDSSRKVPSVGGWDTNRVPPNPWSDIPTGTEMYIDRTMQKSFLNWFFDKPQPQYGEDETGYRKKREVFCGLYGADRNFNKVLDRGPVPKSVRLRAVEIARFNFYDPRVQAITR